jgi:hypothetical protein
LRGPCGGSQTAVREQGSLPSACPPPRLAFGKANREADKQIDTDCRRLFGIIQMDMKLKKVPGTLF